MGISIKHDEIEALIRELAQRRGSSLTEAIGEAVRNELGRAKGGFEPTPSFGERIRLARALVAASPVLDPRTPEEIIGYDEHGLPA